MPVALTSASTYDDAIAQYNNNLSWEGSAIKAAAALEAIRWLLVNRPQSTSRAGRSMNYASLEAEKTRLEAVVSSASANRTSFARGRMLM